MQHKVAVKCPTANPISLHHGQYHLKQFWRCPNASIRHQLDGTLFSQPILFDSVPKHIKHWRDPIVIARHSHGDQYESFDERIYHKGTLVVGFEPEDQAVGRWSHVVKGTEDRAAFFMMVNTDSSIRRFAHQCFTHSLNHCLPLKLATSRDLRQYDSRFRHIFGELFIEYSEEFSDKFIDYEHRNLEDMVR